MICTYLVFVTSNHYRRNSRGQAILTSSRGGARMSEGVMKNFHYIPEAYDKT